MTRLSLLMMSKEMLPLFREAVTTSGWPLLDDSRGKAMFILLADNEVREAYVDTYPD